MKSTTQPFSFSIIVPVYNRSEEVDELLNTLCHQTYGAFEVIIIEDGSQEPCEEIVQKYQHQLQLSYHFKDNSGPGLSRNYGVQFAQGDYLIFFDSDCLIPDHYFESLVSYLISHKVDAFGGPDQSHDSFSPIQKAISYAMTSFFTTAGIRGSNTQNPKKFHPRSFNMGFTRAVFDKTGGYGKMRFGEDVDLSLRIISAGFTTALVPKAFVYHKRRTDFRKFFKQVHNSGIARIHLYKLHPHSLKLVHFLPSLFTIGVVASLCLALVLALVGKYSWALSMVFPLSLYALLVFLDACLHYREPLQVAWLSISASFVQLIGYGTGFLRGVWKRMILRQDNFQAFKDNFYQ